MKDREDKTKTMSTQMVEYTAFVAGCDVIRLDPRIGPEVVVVDHGHAPRR